MVHGGKHKTTDRFYIYFLYFQLSKPTQRRGANGLLNTCMSTTQWFGRVSYNRRKIHIVCSSIVYSTKMYLFTLPQIAKILIQERNEVSCKEYYHAFLKLRPTQYLTHVEAVCVTRNSLFPKVVEEFGIAHSVEVLVMQRRGSCKGSHSFSVWNINLFRNWLHKNNGPKITPNTEVKVPIEDHTLDGNSLIFQPGMLFPTFWKSWSKKLSIRIPDSILLFSEWIRAGMLFTQKLLFFT